MLNRQEFLSLRNNTISSLYNKSKLRYTEIAELQVQDLGDEKIFVRIQRGERIFKVALSPNITENMKLLTQGKEYNEYVFNSSKGNHTHLSRTMITKIIDSFHQGDVEINKKVKGANDLYKIKLVECDYKICKGDEIIEGIALKNKYNAYRIIEILNKDKGK